MRIKICGITRLDDAQAAAELGVEMIGLNFWPKSRRYVQGPHAREWVRRLPRTIETVGLFVDAAPERIRSVVDDLGLDWVQLHGQEPPELLGQLGPVRVIRAFRVHDAQSVEQAHAYAARCRELGRSPDAFLFDTYVPNEPGGTGRAFRWELVCRPDRLEPLILAGGLRPETVADAARQVKPWAVDVAGGVESAPGVKDKTRMAAFVRAARSHGTEAPHSA